MKKKILVLGSSGILGKNLMPVLTKKFVVFHNGLTKSKIDITKFNDLNKLLNKCNPDLVINCAAFTNIDFCEINKKISYNVNVLSLKKIFLIKKKNKLKFKLIQISTDQMYNNKKKIKSSENAKTTAHNEYTKQKLESEKICLKNKSLVLRVNFFAYAKKNIFFWILKMARSKKKLNLFKDIYFSPLSVISLSNIISKIIPKVINENIYGLFNLGSSNSINKSNFCIYILKKMKKAKCNYQVVESCNFLKIKRSANMGMDTNKFQKIFKIKLPYIKNDINKYLKIVNAKI